VRPTQNLEDFGPNLISCVENGPESPDLRSAIDTNAEVVDKPSKQSLVDEEAQRGNREAQRGNEFLLRDASHKSNDCDFAEQTSGLTKEITEEDEWDGLATPAITSSETQRGQELLLYGCEVQEEAFDTHFDTYNGPDPRQQLLEKCDTPLTPAPCDNALSQQQMKLADSFLVFSDMKHNPQLLTRSDTDLSNAQCGSRLNSADAELIFDSELETGDESERFNVPDSNVDVEKSTQDTELKTAVNSSNPESGL